jgi:hypothetical protein
VTSWEDVASKGLDFLTTPSRLGVLVVLALLGFLIYVTPMVVVAAVSWDNTNRLEKAIYAMSRDCMRTVAATQ